MALVSLFSLTVVVLFTEPLNCADCPFSCTTGCDDACDDVCIASVVVTVAVVVVVSGVVAVVVDSDGISTYNLSDTPLEDNNVKVPERQGIG